MTTFLAAYRVTVYAASRNDATSTILTPIGGSVHSDDFKVTTLPALAGWQPYLLDVEGRHSSIDPLDKKVQTGQMVVRLMDPKRGTNLQRWASAYMGNAAGVNPLLGCKLYIEESLDGGATWAAFWVGRIEQIELQGKLVIRLTCRDFADELEEPCFVGRPEGSISYAVEPLLCPLGLSAPYGGVPAARPMTGVISSETFNGYRRIALSAADVERVDNLITAGLTSNAPWGLSGIVSNHGARLGFVVAVSNVRLRFSCASPSISAKEVEVVAILPVKTFSGGAKSRVSELAVREVDASDPFYQSFSAGTIANGTALTAITIRAVSLPRTTPTRPTGLLFTPLTAPPPQSDPVGGAAPLYLGSVNPAQLFADLLDGKFGILNADGTVTKAFARTASTFSALTSPGSTTNALTLRNYRIDKQYTLREFFEEQICKVENLGYRLVPQHNGGNPISAVELFDMRLPTSTALGSIDTITDADLDPAGEITWNQNRADAMTVVAIKVYIEDYISTDELADVPEAVPFIATSLLKQYQMEIIPDKGLGRVELGVRFLSIDALGIRSVSGNASPDIIESNPWLQAQANQVAEHYRSVFGAGPLQLGFVARRTSNTSNKRPGDWVVLHVDAIIDPATRVRGGARLVQITSREEAGPRLKFTGIDAGPYASAAVCTVGSAPATGTPSTNTATLGVTLNADSDPVVVQVNVTETSVGTMPAHNAAGWTQAARLTSSGTATVQNLPSGKRIWFRARSEAAQNKKTKALPSAWVVPGTTGYVDLTVLSAPTSVTVLPSPILSTSEIVASWTNVEPALPIQAILTTGGVDRILATLAKGTAMFTLNPYVVSSTTYTFSVRYIDTLQGVGTKGTSSSFTTPGGFGGPTLSAPTLTLL